MIGGHAGVATGTLDFLEFFVFVLFVVGKSSCDDSFAMFLKSMGNVVVDPWSAFHAGDDRKPDTGTCRFFTYVNSLSFAW